MVSQRPIHETTSKLYHSTFRFVWISITLKINTIMLRFLLWVLGRDNNFFFFNISWFYSALGGYKTTQCWIKLPFRRLFDKPSALLIQRLLFTFTKSSIYLIRWRRLVSSSWYTFLYFPILYSGNFTAYVSAQLCFLFAMKLFLLTSINRVYLLPIFLKPEDISVKYIP